MEQNKEEKEEVLAEPYHDEGRIEINPTIEMRGHQWVQQGYSIICKSCPLRHSCFIGPNHLLVGMDEEGLPIFAKREFKRI